MQQLEEKYAANF